MADSQTTIPDLQEDLESFAPGALGPSECYGEEWKPEDTEATGEGEPGVDKVVSAELQEEFRFLCRKGAEMHRWPRRIEVQNKRRNRLYWAGIQRLAWSWGQFNWQIPYQGPVTPGISQDDSAERPPILDTTNIYQAYGRVTTAPLVQQNPTVRFFPDDPHQPLDVSGAQTAEKLKLLIERNNSMQEKRGDLGRFLWTDGRVIAYTRYVLDGQKYGFDQGKPRGQEEITFFGVLEGRVPITADCMGAMPIVDISIEEDVCLLQAMYPWIAGKINPGSAAFGEDEYDRVSRLSVRMSERMQVLAGDAYQHLATHKRCWLRPAMFAKVVDKDHRKWLLQNFPDGAKVVFAGNSFAYARNESMNDCLSLMRPLPGDGQDTPALGDVLISVQDRVNDLLDIEMEAYEYGLPMTWLHNEAVDIKAIQDERSQYGDHMPMTPPAGLNVQDCIGTEQGAVISPDMMKHTDDLRGSIAQFLVGSPPALYGAEMENQKTASGYAMARDQALGTLQPVWLRLKTFYASIMEQAVQCAAKHREDDMVLNEGDKIIEISLEDLKGNFKCYPEVDENFPESPTQKRQAIIQILNMAGQSPMLMQQLLHPDNWVEFKKYIGLEDLTVLGADSANKAIAEIQELLTSVPVPTMTMQQTPLGPVPTPGIGPSIPFDPIIDDPPNEFPEYQKWFRGNESRLAKSTNPDGWKNVYLRAQVLQQQIQQQQAQQMQMQIMMEQAKKARPTPPPHQGGEAGSVKGQPEAPHQPPIQ